MRVGGGERARAAVRGVRPFLETDAPFDRYRARHSWPVLRLIPKRRQSARPCSARPPPGHDEAEPLIQHTGLPPRHGRTSRGHRETCHPCRRSEVSPHLSGLYLSSGSLGGSTALAFLIRRDRAEACNCHQWAMVAPMRGPPLLRDQAEAIAKFDAAARANSRHQLAKPLVGPPIRANSRKNSRKEAHVVTVPGVAKLI
jgi:hypothetical protein